MQTVQRGLKLTGQIFGRLTVIEPGKVVDKGVRTWKCRCSCGAEAVVRGTCLKKGSTKSCGCLRNEQPGPASRHETPEIAAWAYHFSQYRANARIRKIEMQLTFAEFVLICSKNCDYCGSEPQVRPTRRDTPSIRASGIDRVDNARGYTSDNVVPCCTWCNASKRHHTLDQFVAHCEAVAKHWANKGIIMFEEGPVADGRSS